MRFVPLETGRHRPPASSDARVSGLWLLAIGARTWLWTWFWGWIRIWIPTVRIGADQRLAEHTLFDEIDAADALAKNLGPSTEADIRTDDSAKRRIHRKACFGSVLLLTDPNSSLQRRIVHIHKPTNSHLMPINPLTERQGFTNQIRAPLSWAQQHLGPARCRNVLLNRST